MDPPRHRAFRVGDFIDDVAEVSSTDSESEEADEEEEANELDRQFVTEEEEDDGEGISLSQYLKQDGRSSEDRYRERKEAEVLRQKSIEISQRHKRVNDNYIIAEDEDMYDAPIQNVRLALAPSRGTNPIFLFRVKKNYEPQVLLHVMNRIATRLERSYEDSMEAKLGGVYAAFTPQQGSELIYVEALAIKYAMMLMEGIPYVIQRYRVKQIPYEQMGQAIAPVVVHQALKPGVFVQIRRDNQREDRYKDDYGQVVHVDMNSNRALIKLRPRIDYRALRALKEEGDAEDGGFDGDSITVDGRQTIYNSKKGPSYRPPQADFSYDSVRGFGGDIQPSRLVLTKRFAVDKLCYTWDDEIFVGPFLYKYYPFSYLKSKEVKPPTDVTRKFVESLSTTRFENTISGFEENMNRSLFEARCSTFRQGDLAIILPGNDFENAKVRIEAIEGNRALVRLIGEGFENDDIHIELQSLDKYFEIGEQVKILDGEFKNQTGHVVSVRDGITVNIDNLNASKVISKDLLVRTTEISSGVNVFGQFRLHDMVHLTDDSNGLIVQILTNSCKVLLTNGDISEILLERIKGRQKDFITQSSQGIPLTIGSSVRVNMRGQQQVKATVLHMFKPFVFLKDDLSGDIFVAQGNQCTSPNQRGNRDLYVSRTVGPRTTRDMEMIGKNIIIKKGQYQGRLAEIKDANGEQIKCIIQSTGRLVTFQTSDAGNTWILEGNRSKGMSPYDFFMNGGVNRSKQQPISQPSYGGDYSETHYRPAVPMPDAGYPMPYGQQPNPYGQQPPSVVSPYDSYRNPPPTPAAPYQTGMYGQSPLYQQIPPAPYQSPMYGQMSPSPTQPQPPQYGRGYWR